MDNGKEGGNVNRPPIIDDTNYDYWEAWKISFIKSMDNRTRNTIIKGQAHLVVTTEDDTQSLKLEAYWLKEEYEESHGNSCAFNAIFN